VVNSPMNTVAIHERKMRALVADLNARIIDPLKTELILLTIATSVPIGIANLREVGGPQDCHFEDAVRRLHETRGTKVSGFADMMMGGVCAKEEIVLLCDVLAILAFMPGGVTCFGLTFEACPELRGV
jgi:hypothetical protein